MAKKNGRQPLPRAGGPQVTPGGGIANRLINPQPQQPQGSIFFPQAQQVTPILPVIPNPVDRPPVEITPIPQQPVTPTLPVINDPQKRFKPRRIMPF